MTEDAATHAVAEVLTILRANTNEPRDGLLVLGLAIYSLWVMHDKGTWQSFRTDFMEALDGLHAANDIKAPMQ